MPFERSQRLGNACTGAGGAPIKDKFVAQNGPGSHSQSRFPLFKPGACPALMPPPGDRPEARLGTVVTGDNHTSRQGVVDCRVLSW